MARCFDDVGERLSCSPLPCATMIHTPSPWRGERFDALVRHFEAFPAPHRRRLAALYQSPSLDPTGLATQWCMNPEAVVSSLSRELRGAQSWAAVEELVTDHDMPVSLVWLDLRARRKLLQVGILRPDVNIHEAPHTMPSAMACALAEHVRATRPSLPLLLGRMAREPLEQLARTHQLTIGPGLITPLAIMEYMSAPDAVELLLAKLEEPDWISGALVVLELGGMCFWQEVFGADPSLPAPELSEKVVPLMRQRDREVEVDIAHALMGVGLLFQVPDEHAEHALLAVPEELWEGLWGLGRGWLMDWANEAFTTLRDGGAHKPSEPTCELQPRLKWLACELSRRPLPAEPEAAIAALVARAEPPGEPVQVSLELGAELGLFQADRRGALKLRKGGLALLELPRGLFMRRVLAEWCVGKIGRSADEPLARALGVDESWRQQVLEMLSARHDELPRWLLGEGIPTEMTGSGYLRALEQSPADLLIMELGLSSSYIWTAKLLWLDLLSLLEPHAWYSKGMLADLLQIVAACAMFDHLSHVLEQPGMASYLPVQRASYLNDGFHVAAFDEWVDAILDGLLLPLGLAVLDEPGERVLLDTRHLRTLTPQGLPEDHRARLVQDVVQDEQLDFKAPSLSPVSVLRAVPDEAPLDPDALALSEPIATLLEATRARRITRYDGGAIYLAPL